MTLILRGGQAVGVLGLALMLLAVASRLAGHYVIAGLESGTWFQAGIGATAAGCFALAWAIAARAHS